MTQGIFFKPDADLCNEPDNPGRLDSWSSDTPLQCHPGLLGASDTGQVCVQPWRRPHRDDLPPRRSRSGRPGRASLRPRCSAGRQVVATQQGTELFAIPDDGLRAAVARLLASLTKSHVNRFRAQFGYLPHGSTVLTRSTIRANWRSRIAHSSPASPFGCRQITGSTTRPELSERTVSRARSK